MSTTPQVPSGFELDDSQQQAPKPPAGFELESTAPAKNEAPPDLGPLAVSHRRQPSPAETLGIPSPPNPITTGPEATMQDQDWLQRLGAAGLAAGSNAPLPVSSQDQGRERAAIAKNVEANVTGAKGYPKIAHATKKYAGTFNTTNYPTQEAENAARTEAGTEFLQGAGEAATPLMLALGPTAPVRTAVGLGEGYLASKAAGKVAEEFDASPDTKQFAETAGWFIPNAMTLARNAAGAKGFISPEGAAGEAFGGNVRAGVARTPEGVQVAGRVGPLKGKFTVPGTRPAPEAPAIEPPTIQGEPPASRPAPPPMPAEVADAARAAGVKARTEQAAARTTRGVSPVPPEPPQPPPPMVNDTTVAAVGQAIQSLPKDQQPAAILEATQKAAESILHHGGAVVDGEVHTATTPQEALKVAKKVMDAQIAKADEASNQVEKREVQPTSQNATQNMPENMRSETSNLPAERTSSAQPAETSPQPPAGFEVERRTNLNFRDQVAAMSPEERADALLKMHTEQRTSKLTGLPNLTAFRESESPDNPSVGYFDLDNFKKSNTELSHEGVDQVLLPAVGKLADKIGKEAGVQFFHRSGDEFLARGPNHEATSAAMERLRQEMAGAEFTYQAPDGRIFTKKGQGASYGTGNNTHEAEAAANLDKKRRAEQGLRFERNEEVSAATPQGQQAGQGNVPERPQVAESPNPETKPAVSERETKYKFGNTQAPIPHESEAGRALAAARERIDKADLMPTGFGGDQTTGLETEPHVTVRYGIKSDDTEGIRKYIEQQAPFEATLGKTSKFPPSEHSDGAAPIIAPIEAPELHRIEKELDQHGDFAERTFPEYKPHATVGYVKPDAADKYVGMDVTEGKKFRVDRIAISDRNGNTEEVELKGRPAAPYNYEPMTSETVPEGRRFYHGTQSTLTNLDEADPLNNWGETNIFGPGLYLTDNPNVASGYAATRRQTAGNSKVIFGEIGGARVLDAERPMTPEVRAAVDPVLEQMGIDWVEPRASLADAYAEIRDQSANERIPAYEVQEDFANIEERLLKLGYDGLRHQGGRVAGKKYGPHNVVVLFPDFSGTGTAFASRKAAESAKPNPPEGFELESAADNGAEKITAEEKARSNLETAKLPQPWQTGTPFNSEQIERFNRFTHFPRDVDRENMRFRQESEAERKEAQAKLERYGVNEIPDDVERALDRLAQARYNTFLASIRSREAAPPISVVGPARYNEHARPKRAEAIMQKAFNEYNIAKARVEKAIRQHGPSRVISADDPDALNQLQKKIDGLRKQHEAMKAANAILRNKNLNDEQKVQKIVSDLGFSDTTARKMLKPDFAGRFGFSYELTNTLANIRRLEDRVKGISSNQEQETREFAFDGGKAVDSLEDNRIQLFFDEKPSKDKITDLRLNGFKWAPSIKAWQRQRTPQARLAAEKITGISFSPEEAEQAQEPAESRPVGTSKKPIDLNRGAVIPGEYGSPTEVKTPSGAVPAKYKIVETDSLIPSHNPGTFAKNPTYPEGVQERAYHSSKEAQNRVIQQTQNYDPAYTVNTNPDAVNGPPVVTEDGIVLGGNSRAMATQRLYASGNPEAYKDALRTNAAQFGLTPETISQFKQPVLIREVAKPATVEEARRLGSELNKSMTGALGVSERAVSAGKSISPETLSQIAAFAEQLGDGSTLRDVMRDHGKDLVKSLVSDGVITDRERPQFIDTATGGLSEEGKTFVERAARGLVVDDPDLMDRTPKSVLAKLDASIADILSVADRTDEYNLLPLVREALAEHAEIAQRGTDVELHLSQSGLFGGERNPAVDAIIRKLAEKPKAVRQSLREFAQDASLDKQGQGFLLSQKPTAAQAFNNAFGTDFTEDDLQKSIVQVLEKQAYTQPQGGANVGGAEKEAGRAAEGLQSNSSGAPSEGTKGRTEPPEGELGNARIVPGARSAETGNETGAGDIQQITEAIARQRKTRNLRDLIRLGAGIGEKSGGPSPTARAVGRLKGGFAALLDAYKSPPKWGDYEDATGKWSGADNESALDLQRFSKALVSAVPAKARRVAITNWIEAGGDEQVLRDRASKSSSDYKAGYDDALRLTDEEKAVARNIMSLHDATLAEAQKAGIVEQGVENYIQHIYADRPDAVRSIRAAMSFASLQTRPSFAKKRTLPTYFDAEQLGFVPKNKDAGYLTAVHERSFREALAARAYLKALSEGKASDGRPLTIVSWSSAKEVAGGEPDDSAYLIRPNVRPGEEQADYRVVDHPALRGWKWSSEIEGKPVFVQGDMLVHPEIYQKLKNNLGRSAIRAYEMQVGGKTVRPGDWLLNLSSEAKHFVLSFSGFHQTTLALHGAEHRTMPAGMPELDLNDPRQRGLVNHGMMVAHFDAMDAFGEGVASGGLVTKIPFIGPLYHAYTDYLFRNYLPRLKMAMGLHALDRNLSRYKGKLREDQIYGLTAAQANAAFGGINYRMLGRNKTFQDFLRLFFMAPDFTEARARFVGQAAKRYGAEQFTALVLGALVLYMTARVLNELADKKAHWDKPFSVVHNRKEYGLRTVQEDLFRALSDPKQFALNRLSPIAGSLLRSATDRKYARRTDTPTERLKAGARNMVPIPVQPWVQPHSHDSNAMKAAETAAKMVGINVRKKQRPKPHPPIFPLLAPGGIDDINQFAPTEER